MSVMRTIKVEETYKEWFKTVIKFTLPSSSLKPLSIEYVNDVYRGISAKNCSREEREQSETQMHLQNLGQKMLSNKEWLAFFHNIKNKQHLHSFLVTYLCADDFVQSSPLPILGNNKNETIKISRSVTKIFECNHEESDTRMIFHALQQKTNVVVCSKDTAVLVFMVFPYALNKINEKWVMKIESNKFINITKIVEYLGTDVAKKLPQILAVTGCDTTSLLHGAGKIKVLKKCLNTKEKLRLLNTIGVSCKVSDTAIKDVEKFIQTVCYSGREEESLTETRVRLYKQMKTKTSQSLPSDEKSM